MKPARRRRVGEKPKRFPRNVCGFAIFNSIIDGAFKMLPKNLFLPIAGLILCGFVRGGTISTIGGDSWHDILDNVPCGLVAPAGKGFRIRAVVTVAGKTFNEPIVTDEDRIREVERRCFPRR